MDHHKCGCWVFYPFFFQDLIWDHSWKSPKNLNIFQVWIIINVFVNPRSPPLCKKSANKTEDDDEAENSDFSKEKLDRDFTLRRPSSFAIEDDHDSEMDDGVSESDNNDISMNNLQSTSSSNQNNFARFINSARRMSSGIVLSYNFLKGANSKRRDST
jgi:hypothetical protein